MDKRLVEFIRTLRAAGVRISVAESYDALRAVEQVGIYERGTFQSALRATLIKEADDLPTFDYFFPLFFDTAAPPMFDMEQELTPDQQEALRQALQSLTGNQDALRQLLQQLMRGQNFDQSQLDQAGQRAGLQNADNPSQQSYYQRMMQRALDANQLRDVLDQLEEMLQEMGMSQEAIEQIMAMLRANADALNEQIERYVGSTIARNMGENPPERPDPETLMQRPFQRLTQAEVEALRDETKRLAARLRSRAALRQKRAKEGNPDPKSTIRHNLRYGGTPLEIQYRTRHTKPRLVMICDISTSMRYCAEFMLTLIYELQDQVAKARSFIFISDLVEISDYFKAKRPEIAVEEVLDNNPPGSYNTNLGAALQTLFNDKLDSLDSRTTVIILGDGRNNYFDPRLDLASALRSRSRRVLWFNPEAPYYWGEGDSDMDKYAPLASGVFQVANMAQLIEAIDRIMADG
ncbi:MAG: VWA domain-containing protein [Anaerolineae bacterium]